MAKQIGDNLISTATEEKNGIYWETITINKNLDVVLSTTSSVYNGVAGIALFFLDLFSQTMEVKYKDIAIKAIEWASDNCQTEDNLPPGGLYLGFMSVCYALTRFYETTNDSKYLSKALKIAFDNSSKILLQANQIDDILSGSAGCIIVLLQLHSASRESWLLAIIDELIEKLISRAYPGPKGFYWERLISNTKGLCGMSHGASGVGLAFLTLGDYFKNDGFNWVAEQAFVYELYHFNDSTKNWPDFRSPFLSTDHFEEAIIAFMDSDPSYFRLEGSDMNHWCHGAPGIGLVHLRSFELLGKTKYKDGANLAIKKTLGESYFSNETDPLPSALCLCHGVCGNTDFLFEANKFFDDDSYLNIGRSIASKLISHKTQGGEFASGYPRATGEDTSLMMGNAGIGYFFLRAHNPMEVSSILIPKTIPNDTHAEITDRYQEINISLSELARRVIKKSFKRTLTIIENIFPLKIEAYFKSFLPNNLDYQSNFMVFVNNLIKTAPSPQSDIIKDIYFLECEVKKIEDNIDSISKLYISEKVMVSRGELLLKKDDEEIQNTKLEVNPEITFLETKWLWDKDSSDSWIDNISKEPDQYMVTLRANTNEVIENHINNLVKTILGYFEEKFTVQNIIDSIVVDLDVNSLSEIKNIQEKIYLQIRHMIAGNILIKPNL